MTEFDRANTPWVMNPSGGRWYLLHPEPDDFKIEDIAHNLSNIYRFNGAVRYSVASHSIQVSIALGKFWGRPDLALQGLLHDAAEAVIGDMVSPLKALLPEFQKIENGVWAAIAKRFDVPEELDPLVKQVDAEMGALEGWALFSAGAVVPFRNQWWNQVTFGPDKSPVDDVIPKLPIFPDYPNTQVAKRNFLDLFKDLTENA